MKDLPTTLAQIMVVLISLMPGFFYQGAKERLRGPSPAGQEINRRLVRAVAASLVLDLAYLILLGPYLTSYASLDRASLSKSPRAVGLVGLTLLVVVPVLVAVFESLLVNRVRARVSDAPTAWDGAFRNLSECYIRAQLTDGSWIGGLYSTKSWASGYPESRDLFLERAYRMGPDGSFHEVVDGSRGVYVSGENIRILEVLIPGIGEGIEPKPA